MKILTDHAVRTGNMPARLDEGGSAYGLAGRPEDLIDSHSGRHNSERQRSMLNAGEDLVQRRHGPLASLSDVEGRAVMVLRPYSVTLLRMALGLVFIWFGALKVAHATPVAELVAGAVPWFDALWFVPLLGVVEVVLGLSLIVGRRVTLVAAALAAHLSGTFLVLVMQPHVAFQHGNPILLTTEGEFVVKNLVLVSSALVLASRLGDPHLLTENSAVCPPRRSPNRAVASHGDGTPVHFRTG